MFRNVFRDNRGQAMVEFALVLPLFLLLVCGIIEFGVLYNAQLTLEQDAREGARYAAVHAAEADLTNRIYAHLNIEPLTSSVSVAVDLSQAGAVTVTAGTVVPALTPFGHLLFPEEGKALSAAVTMRIE